MMLTWVFHGLARDVHRSKPGNAFGFENFPAALFPVRAAAY